MSKLAGVTTAVGFVAEMLVPAVRPTHCVTCREDSTNWLEPDTDQLTIGSEPVASASPESMTECGLPRLTYELETTTPKPIIGAVLCCSSTPGVDDVTAVSNIN